MLRTLARIFVQGLIAILPIVVTVYLLALLIWWLESSVRWLLLLFVAEDRQEAFSEALPPGIGVLAAVLVIFLLGLLLRAYLVQRIYEIAERAMQRIPVIKSVYGSVKDLLQYFAGNGEGQQMSQVVLVRMPGSDQKLLGMVTRQTFTDLPEGLGDDQSVAVYLPMSYQLGGFTVILPRDQVEPIEMSIEDGLRFALTAGVTVKERTEEQPPLTPADDSPQPQT